MTPITIKATVNAPVAKVWDYYSLPEHVVQWNAAHESWHCPKAENDFKVGGRFSYRMEARDGSFGFDFAGVYNSVNPQESFAYTMDDQRKVVIDFVAKNEDTTEITVVFDPESINDPEFQKQGWQAILDNFKIIRKGINSK